MTDHRDVNPYAIDPTRLDVELLAQPGLTRSAGVAEAEARLEYNRAEANLKIVFAELKRRVRNDPKHYGFEKKPNNDEVEETALTQPEYAAAVAAVNHARYVLDMASTDTTAMLDRRKMLERRVELLALDYHSHREPNPATPQAREQADSLRRRALRGGGVDPD